MINSKMSASLNSLNDVEKDQLKMQIENASSEIENKIKSLNDAQFEDLKKIAISNAEARNFESDASSIVNRFTNSELAIAKASLDEEMLYAFDDETHALKTQVSVELKKANEYYKITVSKLTKMDFLQKTKLIKEQVKNGIGGGLAIVIGILVVILVILGLGGIASLGIGIAGATVGNTVWIGAGFGVGIPAIIAETIGLTIWLS